MKKIPLTRGGYALVDDQDYEFLNRWRWRRNNRGYACRETADYSSGARRRKTVIMHREVVKPPKGLVTDHINGDKLDNRRCNLRVCTMRDNLRNHGKSGTRKTASRYLGVLWHRRRQRWFGCVGFAGKYFKTSRFSKEHDAALMRDFWAVWLHGQYARTNFTVVAGTGLEQKTLQ